MLFNSYIFIFLFLPVTVAGWFLLNKTKASLPPKIFLLAMSLVFYAYFNIKYLPIIVVSIAANYLIYLGMKRLSKKAPRRLLFWLGMVLNIGILFYYKYLGFFTENINALFKTDFNVVKLVLPLGISFFTFQQVSFVIDSYKNNVPDYSLLDYALFVSFFPQLIAGPIVLHSEIIPQFADKGNKKFNYENFAKGIYAFTFGLAKKVLIADTLGNAANIGFGSIPSLNSVTAAVSMLAYTMQIYFDFSGYCDMATGIGLMFNINLPMNFNSPYKALDMNDFWKRWHITLTRFLTTNLYIPLGGNRKGRARTYLNQLIVFAVSGLWHGANWTFIVWGIMNGVLVILSKILSPRTEKLKKKAPVLPWLATFALTNLLWVYFRADSISDANHMIVKIFSMNIGGIDRAFFKAITTAEYDLVSRVIEKILPAAVPLFGYVLMFAMLAFAVFASTRMKNTNERLAAFKPGFIPMAVMCVLFVWSVISLSGVSTFLYFNF
ncbi:MAG: MBOAT family protein [Clostridiales bacterium]|nr:MBOAT family protein [Clostridiales bacterium]